MGRHVATMNGPRVVTTLGVILATTAAVACGDPIIVLGDAPGIMRIVIGVGDSLGTRVDSLAARTRLTEPSAVVFAADQGMLYAADRGAVRQISGVTTRIARLFSVTSRGRAEVLLDGSSCAAAPCIIEVTAMTRAPDGSLIIADAVGQRVLRYVPFGAITVLAGTGVGGDAADGAIAAQSPVNGPAGVAVAADGSVAFSEANSNRVRSIGTDGRLRSLAGNGSTTHSGDGGPALAAGVPAPMGLRYVNGTLYIAEFGGAAVRAVSAAGTISTIAGTGVPGFSGDGGAAVEARLDQPVSLAVSGDGRTLFVSDQGNHRVRVVSLSSGSIRTFAGTGDTRYTGNRRAAGETSLSRPWGIDAAGGFLFVADRGHAVIWRTAIGLN